MKTDFSILLSATGLSQRHAAAHLRLQPDTVRAYVAGRRNPGVGVMREMITLAKINMKTLSAEVAEIERGLR